MAEQFFSSKQAAQITGCNLRQLQYWREKGVVVPSISATGTGRSIYYSRSELVELAVMEYWLSVGLTFEVAAGVLLRLKEKAPNLGMLGEPERFMLCWQEKVARLELMEFDREDAIASLDRGQPVIPIWLEQIHSRLNRMLRDHTR